MEDFNPSAASPRQIRLFLRHVDGREGQQNHHLFEEHRHMIYRLKDLRERRCMNMSRPYSVAQRPSCPLMNGRCHCLELWKAVFLGWQEQERGVLEVYHDTVYRTFENKFVARSQRQHHDLELLRELLAEVIARRGKLFGHRDLAQRAQHGLKN